MKIVLLAFFTTALFLACQNKQKQNETQPPIPKALEKKSSYEIVTKRGYNNVVEDLYEELVKNTAELQEIETALEKVTNNKNDSTKNYNFYNDKNIGYYDQANSVTNTIKDSLLKEKVKVLIASSSTTYKNKIDAHNKLIEGINTKLLTLDDMHTFLKIQTTMAVMEKYQKDNLPSSKPLSDYTKQIDNLQQTIDNYTKK